MYHTPPPGESVGLNGNEKKSGSPKYTRLNEKEDLANLNNRLACYIDRVRNLEYENNRLTVEIKNSQETLRRETSSVKSLYEGELAQTRKCIDKIANEKAKLQIDSQRLFADNLALQSECDARIDECKKLREELSALERRCSELCNACNSLEAEKKRLVEANKDLLKEKASSVSELTQLRNQFEKETLARVDLENALATLKEDYTFNIQLLKQQLHDAKKKIADERTEIDGKLSKEYEERLCHSLQELRDQYELDLEENKEEMRKMYEDKIKCLENQLSRSNNITSMAMEDARSMQSKIDKLNQTVKDLEKERNLAVSDARELEKRLDQMKSEYIKEYAYHEDEMKKLREEMANQAKEYEELMDVKVALDMEISAFRKLLESEEERLNITPVHSSSLNSSSRRILKGKRRHEESFEAESNVTLNCTNSSSLALSEVSPEGKFIKIINNSPEDVAIGGWELVQVANGTKVTHLFKSKAKVKGGKTLTVWSGEETATHRGDGEEQVLATVNFQPADQMTITLLDSSGQEVATAVLNKVTSTSSRLLTAKRHVGHSFSQDQLQYSDEKCSLM